MMSGWRVFAFWSAGLVGGKKVNVLVFLSKKHRVWKLLVYKYYMIYKSTTSIILWIKIKQTSPKHHHEKNEPWLAASVIFPIFIPTSEFVKTSRAKSCLGRSKERRNWLNSTGVLRRQKTEDVVFFRPQPEKYMIIIIKIRPTQCFKSFNLTYVLGPFWYFWLFLFSWELALGWGHNENISNAC